MGLFYGKNSNGYPEPKSFNIGFALVGMLLLVIVAPMYGLPSYGRYQRLQNEHNQTSVNDIQIAQTQQLVKVQQQKAQIQIAQAIGIAKAQEIIKSTLTPAYLQYEAIEAQKAEINSPNHTIIYVPSGANGIPLVQTTNP